MSVDLVRIVDSIHRDKNIPKEVLFEGLQSALAMAARKHYPDAEDIQVHINTESGTIETLKDGESVEPPDFGRIAAQTAKQVIIQKIREAERDTLYDEFDVLRGEMVTGTVQRFEGGAVTVNLGKTDAILPRGEQIPGESHHPGERVRAIVLDVRKVGQRVKIILSRTHPDFVRRLFELEIPEISDQTIQIKALAREAGYRSKVAVSSIDQKVDAVGACVGVRGTRIKNIVDELGGERIDIVRWNDSLQVLIPNALQPAEIEEVLLCQLLGRAIVLVRDDQLSLAIGRRGQNVRLASKLVGWDIEIMTGEELDEFIDRAVGLFSQLEGCDTDLANRLVEQGILSFDDLSVMEIDDLVATIDGFDEELATSLVSQAEAIAESTEEEDLPRRKSSKYGGEEGGEPSRDFSIGVPADVASAVGLDRPESADTEAAATESTQAETDQGETVSAVETADQTTTEAPESDEKSESNSDSEDEVDEEPHDPHDLELADEVGGIEHGGHEVTHPPDEEEEFDASQIEIEAEAAWEGPPPLSIESGAVSTDDNAETETEAVSETSPDDVETTEDADALEASANWEPESEPERESESELSRSEEANTAEPDDPEATEMRPNQP